jgi:hypothetical protein
LDCGAGEESADVSEELAVEEQERRDDGAGLPPNDGEAQQPFFSSAEVTSPAPPEAAVEEQATLAVPFPQELLSEATEAALQLLHLTDEIHDFCGTVTPLTYK